MPTVALSFGILILLAVPSLEWRQASDFLSVTTESDPTLFSAPTSLLQGKIPAAEIPQARKALRILYNHKDELSPETARRAALLGFAIQDYRTGLSFADHSLSQSPQDPQLLMVRGLLDYASGYYPSATADLQESKKLTPGTGGATEFVAALNTNLGLSLGGRGAVTNNQSDYESALRHLEEGAAAYAKLGNREQEATNKLDEAEVLVTYGRYADAHDAIERAASIFQELRDENGGAQVEIAIGRLILKEASGQFLQDNDAARAASIAARAREHLERALAISQRTEYRLGIADAKNALCVFWTVTGNEADWPNAARNCQEAAAIYSSIGNRRGEANALGNLGNVLRNQKQYNRALESLSRSLKIDQEIGFELGVGRQLFNLGRCYSELGEKEKARKRVMEAQQVFRRVGAAYELAGADKFLKEM